MTHFTQVEATDEGVRIAFREEGRIVEVGLSEDEVRHLVDELTEWLYVSETEQDEALKFDGVIEVGTERYMRDTRGALVPINLVRPIDKLTDETVRRMIGFARDLSAQIARFRGHCYDDIGSLQALIAQEYGARVGGPKGNVQLTTYDGTLRVSQQVADLIEFGPELQSAKVLVDACLSEWSAEARDEIRAIVARAFNVDREGRINRAELFMLLRVEIEDARWKRAMDAIRDSIRVIGSKTYVRFYERASADDRWSAISIDLATA
ncbi:DUF3164 family protein [Segnochrobactrum spirostomi]|uniref:DUF3164 family protein n=1 Tax=Segnochrobactrum spirostomi TaxID=2608987 RepID=UPI0028A98667|nr:DUF3164 family protein [Segnochrobactrum spirostomi]